MAIDWKGVFPAVTTKFTAADELDLDLFKLNIQAQLDAKNDKPVIIADKIQAFSNLSS